LTNSHPSERTGSQQPAFLTLPADRQGSQGEEAIELAELAGLHLDEWQQWLLTEMLQVNSRGRWAAYEACIVLPRQNGKGSLLEARQLWGLFLGGEMLAVHTAHEFKTAYEHFLRIRSLVENTPALAEKVERIRTGAGDQAIELKNGARLRFIARSSGSGRGLTGDTIYLDEAFALTPEIMGALLPTLSAVPNPQLVYTSSAPRFSQKVLFELVQRGRSHTSEQLLYAEWGNEQGVQASDKEAWYRANPALGIRILEHSVQAELEAMRAFPEEFLRERLGVVLESDAAGVIPLNVWRELADPASSAPTGVPALAVGPGMAWSALGFAGRRPDGSVHVEVVRHSTGTAWLIDSCRRAYADTGHPIILDAKSPSGGVVQALTDAGVPVQEVSPAQFVRACASLQEAALNGRIHHLDQPALNEAITGADIRPVGEAWAFSARASSTDITPLLAVTLAASGLADQATTTEAGFTDLSDFLDDD
jgi:phage terminase large subunit-like protein